MANRLHTTTAETGYLLGTLPEQERARLEYEFFTNDEKFQELELAEDDLIDAYIRDELTAAEQEQFRERLLIIPRIVERVDFARALAERTSLPSLPPSEAVQHGVPSIAHPKPKPRWWEMLFGSRPRRLLFVAYVVLVLVGGGVLVAGWLRLRDESARLAAERAAVQRRKENLDKQSTEQQATAEKLTARLQQLAEDQKALEERQRHEERNPSFLGSISILLMPGGSRGPGAASDLKFAPDTQNAELKLLLTKAEYRSYNVTVKTPDGQLVTIKKGIKPRKTGSRSIVAISVPVRRLPPGDYVAYLAGLTSTGQAEGVDDYSFRVLKNPK